MSQFQGVSEKFHLNLLGDDGHSTSRVYVQVGLDGLNFLTPDGARTLRKYPLNNISRWALRGTKLVLYTKSSGDVEENTVVLQGDEDTTRSVLDTLTCSCMQMVELLQSRESSSDNVQATNSLSNLLAGGSKRQQALPTADEVSFWTSPEKTGFMFSQGEHIKNWRRRWFILKQGYLFRFATADVSATSKPKGVVDLSKVTDVSSGRETTGRNNSIKLSTVGATVSYICDSETEQVEWMSAIETAVAKIVKQAAGVEDEPAPAPRQAPKQEDWVRQHLRSSGKQAAAPSRSNSHSDRADRHTMVSITGYDDSSSASAARPSKTYPDDTAGYGSLGYGNIAGIAGIADSGPSARSDHQAYSQPASGHQQSSYAPVEYPAYPSLVPQPASQPAPAQHEPQGYSYAPSPQQDPYAQHYQQQQQPQEQLPSHSGLSTGTAAWDSPSYQQQSSYEAPAANVWQMHHAPDGRPYYHNTLSGATQWEAPAGFA